MDPTASLYTRQQLGQLAGLDDTTLNYWSREGLLIPAEGGTGRGSHRRFDFVQVNKAAILGAMRRFGLNLTTLKSFADLMEEGVRLCGGNELHPGTFKYAASLATALHQFRHGETILIKARNRDEERPAGLKGDEYVKWLLAKRPAVTEAEVIEHKTGVGFDHDELDAVIAFAERLGPGKEVPCEIYQDLVADILAPGYSDIYSWLLGFDADGTWRIEFGSEGAKFFETLDASSPEDFGPGIFIPTSGIIRKIWGLKKPAEFMRDREAERLQETLAAAGITATVTPNPDPEQGFHVDAPGFDWAAVQVVLDNAGYAPPAPETEAEAAEARG